MKGVLILAHGSRQAETEDTLNQIVERVRENFPGIPLEIAFLQFSPINLEAGLEKLIHRGVSEVKVVPYFLFDGVHIREDIPAEIQAYLKESETINIQFGRTLGADPRLAEILSDRIKELL